MINNLSRGIVIVNSQGYIKELVCPFRVCCIIAVDNIRVGSWVWVDVVTDAENVRLLYRIHGNFYLHSHFIIRLPF